MNENTIWECEICKKNTKAKNFKFKTKGIYVIHMRLVHKIIVTKNRISEPRKIPITEHNKFSRNKTKKIT